MNKKFSTLVAVVLAATSFGATAQIVPAPTTNGGFAKYVTAPVIGISDVEKGYVQIVHGNASSGRLVAMLPGTTAGTYRLALVLPNTTSEDVEVRNTLWKVVASGDGVSGYSYQLQNLGTGEYLAFNTDEATAYNESKVLPTTLTATIVGSEAAEWTWLDVPAKAKSDVYFDWNNPGDARAFEYAFAKDSVMTLIGTDAPTSASVGTPVDVVAVKYSKNNKPAVSNQLTVVPFNPAAFTLGVNDLNSLLWKQDPSNEEAKAEFTFTPNVINDETNVFGNLFTENNYRAVSAVGFPAANGVATNPFGSYTDYTTLYTAEAAYQEALSKKAWIDALLNVCLTDGKIDASKVTATTDAMTFLTSGTTFTSTDKKSILEELENISWPKDAQNNLTAQAVVVKAQAIDYVNKYYLIESSRVMNDAALDAVAGSLYTFYSSNFTANATKAAVEALIKAEFVDKTGTGTEATKTAVKTAKETVKATFDTDAAANGWVSLMLEKADKDEDNTYLSVARSFVTETANERQRPLGFTTGKFADFGYTDDAKARLDLNGRYNFQFTYFPNADSLVIRTGGWAKKNKAQASWGDMSNDGTANAANPELGKAAASPAGTPTAAGTENNIVKLIYLANNHSEVTVGSSDYYVGANPNTINTRISLKKIDDEYVKTTLEDGVYFFNFYSEDKEEMQDNDKYAIANFNGSNMYWANPENNYALGTVQEYKNMPRTQWVVKQNKGAEGTQTINIYNREYPQWKAERIQLYKAGENVFAVSWGSNIEIARGDTLAYTKLAADDGKIGYKAMPSTDALVENLFALRYFNGLNAGNLVNATEDEAMFVNPEATIAEATQFVFVPKAKDVKYGYDNKLIRNSYNVKVQGTELYLKEDGKDGYTLTDKASATEFYFKENNGYATEDGEWVSYYAVVKLTGKDTDESDMGNVSGVKHPSLVVSVEGIETENSIATFAFEDVLKYQYRRLGVTIEDGLKDLEGLNTVKFYRTNVENTFLYENSANRNANNGEACLNFLGETNLADQPENAALPFLVDTAYIRNKTSKPLYLLSVRNTFIPAGKYNTCPDQIEDCHKHPTIDTEEFRKGAYLVGLADSADIKQVTYQNNFRLAFVEAKHMGDTLTIDNSKFTNNDKLVKNDSLFFSDKDGKQLENTATFAFKLVDPTANDGDFYMETKSKDKDGVEATYYVRVHNSVPVLVKEIGEAATFNVEDAEGEEATANEGIAAEGVKVIATEGAVIVKGAEGKKVTISNVLGQTIANMVITSSEATISAPKGYVTVAVEGEKAVKAIVK